MRVKNRQRATNTPIGAFSTEELKDYLGVCHNSAVAFGEAAGARIQIGRSVRWNRAKIDDALNAGMGIESTRQGVAV